MILASSHTTQRQAHGQCAASVEKGRHPPSPTPGPNRRPAFLYPDLNHFLEFTQNLEDAEIDAFAVVAVAGIAAEGQQYEEVMGQNADLLDLQRILLRSKVKLSDAQQQNITVSWAEGKERGSVGAGEGGRWGGRKGSGDVQGLGAQVPVAMILT